ncbi:MAG: AAA family ATPase [Armatimonadota bacterium]
MDLLSDFLADFKSARRVGTPLLAVVTADPAATQRLLSQQLKEGTPLLQWDTVEGLGALNEPGREALLRLYPDPEAQKASANPLYALQDVKKLEPHSVLFLHNLHRFLEDPAVCQGLWNLRDWFKTSRRMAVVLCPYLELPPELQQDVVLLEEPLPGDDQLTGILERQYTALQASVGESVPDPEPELLRRGVELLRGLSAYAAEQTTAMAMTPEGVNLEKLGSFKRRQIEQTRGLTLNRSGETFADIGGLEQIKRVLLRLQQGPRPFRAVVRLDEIEKALAGASGPQADSSGVSQDALLMLLTAMEDHGWTGILAVGHPGSGKSVISKAAGNTFQIPTLNMDLGGAKGGIVGESEARIRAMLRVIHGIAGDGALFLATCNRLETLPPELRRRFRLGTYFFDLPTREELDTIWSLCLRQFELDPEQPRPEDTDFTGADVRNTCELAYLMGCSLVEAAEAITPTARTDMEAVTRLRQLAHGKFRSASRPGFYRYQEKQVGGGERMLELGTGERV